MIEIIESMGVDISWIEKNTLKLKANTVDPEKINFTPVKRMRSSVLLFGPLLVRCKNSRCRSPADALFAPACRSHFIALEKLGATITKKTVFINLKQKT